MRVKGPALASLCAYSYINLQNSPLLLYNMQNHFSSKDSSL